MRATLSHFEIPARQIDRAAGFYQAVFGWSAEPRPWAGGPYFVLHGAAGTGEQPGIDGGLLQRAETLSAPTSASSSAPPRHGQAAAGGLGDLRQPLLVIHITGAALQHCLDRIVAHGGEVDLEVIEVGKSGRFARFRDPEGNLLGLWQEAGWAHPQGR